MVGAWYLLTKGWALLLGFGLVWKQPIWFLVVQGACWSKADSVWTRIDIRQRYGVRFFHLHGDVILEMDIPACACIAKEDVSWGVCVVYLIASAAFLSHHNAISKDTKVAEVRLLVIKALEWCDHLW